MIKQFKTLAEFKRVLEIGDLILVTRSGEKQPVREVSVKQSNSFALKCPRNGKTSRDGTKNFVDSWIDYPKAKDCWIENNILHVKNLKIEFIDFGTSHMNDAKDDGTY